jgi:hypothetical protein
VSGHFVNLLSLSSAVVYTGLNGRWTAKIGIHRKSSRSLFLCRSPSGCSVLIIDMAHKSERVRTSETSFA